MANKPTYYTKIGKHSVPVYNAEKPTLLAFLGAKKGKCGVYAFWTAEFKKATGKRRKVWGRAKIGLSAGDRFDRMGIEKDAKSLDAESRRVYAAMWQLMGQGSNVKLVRPSTKSELYRWLETHSHRVFGRFKPVEIAAD